MTDTLNKGRRDFLTVASVGGAVAALGVLGANEAMAAGIAAGRSEKPLKAAFSNAGLQATWCAQGKQAAEYWGSLFNAEVTWFDGQFGTVWQRAAIDNMASQKWDFVAIQAFGIGTLTAPVNKMIDAGIPVIDMDTLIAPLDTINILTFLAPDNEFMGAAVTQALVNAINGEGTMVMTQGALGHTGAQGRAKGPSSPSSRRFKFTGRPIGRRFIVSPSDETLTGCCNGSIAARVDETLVVQKSRVKRRCRGA